LPRLLQVEDVGFHLIAPYAELLDPLPIQRYQTGTQRLHMF